MTDTAQQFTQTAAALAALMLVLSVLSPIGTVAAVDGITVAQQADSTTINPGDTITFTTDVSVDDSQIEANSIGLQTDRPGGWEITRQDGTFLGAGPDGWLWFSPPGVSGSDTVQYTVEVPDDATNGDYDISVTASTEGGASTTDTTTITVQPEQTNTAPDADAGDDQTVDEGDTVTLDASGSSDQDGDSLSYSWTVTDVAGTSVSLSDAATATPTFTAPSVDSETTLTFQVEVADGNGGTDTDSVSVTVQPTQPANQAPTIEEIADQTVTEGDSATVPVSADDPDGDSVSLSLSQAPDFVSLSDGELTIAPDSGDAGTYTVEVTADDGTDQTTESFEVIVEEPVGPAISVSQSADQTTVQPGDTITFTTDVSVDGSQIDANSVGLQTDRPEDWEITRQDGTFLGAGPDGWLWFSSTGVSGSDTVEYTVTVPQSATSGTYTVSVTASTEGEGNASATDETTITVEQSANTPPTIDAISDQTVTEGDSTTVPATADDPDGDTVSLSLSEAPDFVSLSNGELTIAPQSGDAGTYTVEVTADDGTTTTTESFQVTVEEPANQAPSAAVDVSPADPEVGEDVTFSASDSTDSDGSIESYEWDFGDGQTASGEEVTHSYDDAGEYTVELTATDDDGATDTVTETITVSEAPNEAPTAAFDVSPSDPQVDETVTLDAEASNDADGEIDSYEWTITPPSGETEETLLDSDFEDGSLSDADWSHDAIEDSADAGVSDATSNSGSYSAYHLGGEGALVSDELDASDADAVAVSYWIQKGSEAFSENPDAGEGEDLVVEYLDDQGDWVEVDRVEDTVEPGAEATETLTLSDDALHDGLQIRFRQQGASISDGDYWHVDDVSVTATSSGSEPMAMTGETATFTPSTAGDYEVTLTVTDDDGATDATTQTITVTDATDQPASVTEAIASLNDADDDAVIETAEIQQAIDMWVEDDPVPGTGGETISTEEIQQLINMWVEDEPVDGNGGGSQ